MTNHVFIDPQPNAEVAPLDWDPHPGFGFVELFCDDKRVMKVWNDGEAIVQDFEDVAMVRGDLWQDPRWWFDIAGPFRGATYERQGTGRWVLVASREGFS